MKALWLSGGKDSVACMFLHEAELSDIQVLWANTGRYLPEHLAWMETLRVFCPNWHEVKTDRDGQNAKNGLPADVVPVRVTNFGAMATGHEPKVKLQSQIQCCYENISGPLWERSKNLKVTEIICGQRNAESYKAPRKHGDVIDGITFSHPIEDWSTERVVEYVRSKIDVPDFYRLGRTSLDCYDCTAYLGESEDWVHYMKTRHPNRYKEFVWRLQIVAAVVDAEMKPMQRILEDAHA